MQTALIGEVTCIYLCSNYFWVIFGRSRIITHCNLLTVSRKRKRRRHSWPNFRARSEFFDKRKPQKTWARLTNIWILDLPDTCIRLQGSCSHSHHMLHEAQWREHKRLTSCFTAVSFLTIPFRDSCYLVTQTQVSSSYNKADPNFAKNPQCEVHVTGLAVSCKLLAIYCSPLHEHQRKKRPLHGIPRSFQHFHVLLATSPRTANVCNVVGPHEGRDVFSGGRGAAGVL